MKTTTLLLFCFFSSILFSQETDYSEYGTLYRFELSTAPFPHPARAGGYTYNDEHYSAEEHYSDSTTLVFIPEYIDYDEDIDLLVYFHGWGNNVDTVLVKFDLINQFHGSCRNAIYVMPEGPKNAPDSFGGKLEEAGNFKLFIDDMLNTLQSEAGKDISYENIILAGHSGAYRVIAHILLHGGLTDKINEVYLFDGLYADVEKYSYWLDHYNGRFIDIYTPNGGTKRDSENLMKCLTAWDITFIFIDDDDFTEEQLTGNRIIFIASELKHSEVISTKDQMKKFLMNGEKF